MDSAQSNARLLKELRESEAGYRAILENTMSGIIVIDQNGAIDFFDPAAERIFGYCATEVLGKNVKLLMTEPDQARYDGFLQNYLRTGEREVVGRRKDGSTVSVDLELGEFRVGEKRAFVGTIRDITEWNRVSEGTTTRLTLAIRAANVGIWDYNVVTQELIWDDAMYALYGISAENFSGAYEAWEKGLHPEDMPRAVLELQNALSDEKDFDTEFRVVWPDGSHHHL